MVSLSINKSQMRELRAAIAGTNKRLEKELEIAVRQAAGDGVKTVAKKITAELNVTQSSIKDIMPKPRVRGGKSPVATVCLPYDERFSLKRFKVRQNRAGVAYRVDKRKGLSRLAGGFMGPTPSRKEPRLGGHAFKRLGKARKPIVKLHGASPWGSFKARNLRPAVLRAIGERLEYRVGLRIRQAIRKKQGKF